MNLSPINLYPNRCHYTESKNKFINDKKGLKSIYKNYSNKIETFDEKYGKKR